MTKFDQMWYFLHICYNFATFVNPFFGAVTGDTVRVRKPGQKTWTPAVVTRVTNAPRSYVVNSEGTSYRRNRRDLIKTTEATNHQQRLEDSETNTTSPVHDPVSSEKVSSEGRIIRPPVWSKDYVTY